MGGLAPFRVLITGSRHATLQQHGPAIRNELALAVGHIPSREMGRVVLVHGDAPGVDQIAFLAVQAWPWGVQVEPHPAKDFGPWPACGPRRNTHMVNLGADICLAFPQPGSRGTWDCAEKAVNAGIHTILRSLPPTVRS